MPGLSARQVLAARLHGWQVKLVATIYKPSHPESGSSGNLISDVYEAQRALGDVVWLVQCAQIA